MIQRYSVWEGGKSHPRGLGFTFSYDSEDDDEEEDANFNDEEDHDQDKVGPSNIACPKATFSILQQYLDERNTLEDKRFERLAARQDHIFATQNNFNAVLVEIMALLDLNTKPFQLPMPQPLLVYPPPEPAEEPPVEPDIWPIRAVLRIL